MMDEAGEVKLQKLDNCEDRANSSAYFVTC